VRSGRRDPVYLLPELCFVTGLTTDMKSDRRMTTNIQALTRVAPHDRVKKMNDFSQQINYIYKRCKKNSKYRNIHIQSNLY
jgi:aubergine-like protein